MKTIGNCVIIYRVVANSGPYVSNWVLEKKQAKEIMEKVAVSPIFGGNTYHIEESTLAL
jgi:hypothetical protein